MMIITYDGETIIQGWYLLMMISIGDTWSRQQAGLDDQLSENFPE